MTVARVLKLRGELTGPPALFWGDRRPAEELYDVLADPEEIRNLADDPQQAETLAQLRTALDHWIERTDDQGRFPEAPPDGMRKSSARVTLGTVAQ